LSKKTYDAKIPQVSGGSSRHRDGNAPVAQMDRAAVYGKEGAEKNLQAPGNSDFSVFKIHL